MTQVIDRRKNAKGKSSENRQKFLKRVKGAIKEQLPTIISQRKIKNYGASGGKVRISRHKGISEPSFRNGEGGKRDYVIPGNKEYIPGDTIPRDSGGGGSGRGRQGSNEGTWEDDFVIELSQQEFLDYLFEDLELPNLVERQLKSVQESKFKNAGFNKDGSPNKLSIIRSFKQSLSRRIALGSILKKKLKEYQEPLNEYLAETKRLLGLAHEDEHEKIIQERKLQLEQLDWFQTFLKLEERSKNLPFFDPIDLRYKQLVKYQVPTTHATMIMVMDNSGSMGQEEKTIARKFFYLLYAFLERQYKNIDCIFISHTIEAKIMDEDEFFNTQESGGTMVSSALEVVADEIVRIGNKSNIYVCQVSDGDNFTADNAFCEDLLSKDIVNFVQYYAYIQIDDYHYDENDQAQMTISRLLGSDKGLWASYQKIADAYNNFKMKRVYEERDIYAVFQQLFEKKT